MQVILICVYCGYKFIVVCGDDGIMSRRFPSCLSFCHAFLWPIYVLCFHCCIPQMQWENSVDFTTTTALQKLNLCNINISVNSASGHKKQGNEGVEKHQQKKYKCILLRVMDDDDDDINFFLVDWQEIEENNGGIVCRLMHQKKLYLFIGINVVI